MTQRGTSYELVPIAPHPYDVLAHPLGGGFGVTSSACADRATSPRSSYPSDSARPTAPPPRVVRALMQTHSPSGGRTTCTLSSVFMKFHSAGSSAAEAPEAESTQA